MDPNKENPTAIPPETPTFEDPATQPPSSDAFNTSNTEVPAANDVVPANPFFSDNNTAEQPPLSPEAAQPVAPFDSQAPVNTPPVAPTPDVVSPEVPVATPFTSGAPVPEPPKKNPNAKKIVIIASVVGGVVLLALAAFIIFFLLTTVSKDDYRAAVKQYNQLTLASSSLDSDMSSLGSSFIVDSDDGFNETVTKTQDSISKIKTENESLGKLKAVRVGDGAPLYDTFNGKLATYLAYGNDLIVSVKNVRPAMIVCDKIGDADGAEARVTEIRNCVTSLGNVKDIPSAEFKTYVNGLKDGYTQYATTYESMNALTSPYGSQYEEYKTLRDQLRDAQDKISQAGKTFADEIKKHDDDVNVKDSANALGDFLEAKQR